MRHTATLWQQKQSRVCEGLRARHEGLGTAKPRRVWHSQPRRSILTVSASAAVANAPANSLQKAEERRLAYELRRFLGPATLLPLADPLIAFNSTIAVGKHAGTAQLAALGPADMLLSFTTYMCRGLHVATQSLVGTALHRQDRRSASSYLGTGLYLAIGTGGALATLLSLGSAWLVPALGVQDVEVALAATDYLRLRALGLPAVLSTMVLQSSKLAQRDSLTPCLSVALTVVVSLLANIVFVAVLGWGLKGAALTTVGTQYLGALALLAALHHPSSKLRPDWSIPSPEMLRTYLKTMAPVTAMFTAKNLCYLIAQTAAAGLSTVSLAAHQAAYSLWTLFTWAIAPLEQAGMAFLPSLTHTKDRRTLAKLLLTSGAALGAAAAVLLAGVSWVAPGVLVQDAATQGMLGSITIQGALALFLVGIDTSASSINIALKDYDYVARSYVVTLGVTAGYFALCRQQGWGLAGVWWGLAVFFGMRCMQSLPRAAQTLQLWPEFSPSTKASQDEDQTARTDQQQPDRQPQQQQAGRQSQPQQAAAVTMPTAAPFHAGSSSSSKAGNNVVALRPSTRLAMGASTTVLQPEPAAAM